MASAFDRSDELPLAEMSDGQLLARSCAGDGDAFAMVYRRYVARLVSIGLRKGLDRGSAEDVAHETLLRAFVHAGAFDVAMPLWPWLKVAARNLIIDRSRRRHPELRVTEDFDLHEGVQPAIDFEDRQLIRDILARLPERQGVALQMHYLEDISPKHAAGLLGISQPAFDQLLFRARRRFQHEYHGSMAPSPASPG